MFFKAKKKNKDYINSQNKKNPPTFLLEEWLVNVERRREHFVGLSSY